MCQGARRAVISGAIHDRASKAPDRWAAALFSSSIREYSAREHEPCAIKRARRPTVSHEAYVSSIIIAGNELGRRRDRLLIVRKWDGGGSGQATIVPCPC